MHYPPPRPAPTTAAPARPAEPQSPAGGAPALSQRMGQPPSTSEVLAAARRTLKPMQGGHRHAHVPLLLWSAISPPAGASAGRLPAAEALSSITPIPKYCYPLRQLHLCGISVGSLLATLPACSAALSLGLGGGWRRACDCFFLHICNSYASLGGSLPRQLGHYGKQTRVPMSRSTGSNVTAAWPSELKA